MTWKRATKNQMPPVGRAVLTWVPKAPKATRCQYTAIWTGRHWETWDYHGYHDDAIPGVTYWRELPPDPKQPRRR